MEKYIVLKDGTVMRDTHKNRKLAQEVNKEKN